MDLADRIRDIARIGITIEPPTMTTEKCVARKYAHNQRCRWTDGFYCEDCGAWVPETDETFYFTNRLGNRQERL